MTNKPGRRRFGAIRKLRSGRYQVRYLGPDGRSRTGSETYARKSEAEQYLVEVESQMMRRDWIDPSRARIELGTYARRWIQERPRLRPRTVELYDLLLRLHIDPFIGRIELGKLTTPMIRTWRAQLADAASDAMAAKAYRLLRAVLNTAVKEDELLRVNPCRIPGADKEQTEERPVLTIPQVMALAELMPKRYRALVLISTFGCLRWGEVIALQRRDVRVDLCTVTVTKAYSELTGSALVVGPTKSRAGVRTVTIPRVIADAVKEHLNEFTGEQDDALIFTGGRGGPLRRSNFRTAVKWKEQATEIGFPELHFHDLRHTGNTLAAQTGTSLRDLMTRMGHDSPRAALIYQHASADADRAIANALDDLIKGAAEEEAEEPTEGSVTEEVEGSEEESEGSEEGDSAA